MRGSKITHATGFSQWLMTEFDKRRIHSAFGRAKCGVQCLAQDAVVKPKFFSSAGALPSKTTYHSLLATRSLAIR
jgi:hypothetical protein